MGFLSNFLVGEEELFSLVESAQPFSPSWAIFVLPLFFHKCLLCMWCAAEPMRRCSTGAPPKAVAETLIFPFFFFLRYLDPMDFLVQSKGVLKVKLLPSSPGEGGDDSCHLLTCVVLATLLGECLYHLVLSLLHTARSSHHGGRGCSPTAT